MITFRQAQDLMKKNDIFPLDCGGGYYCEEDFKNLLDEVKVKFGVYCVDFYKNIFKKFEDKENYDDVLMAIDDWEDFAIAYYEYFYELKKPYQLLT